jgi:hypothetical protein
VSPPTRCIPSSPSSKTIVFHFGNSLPFQEDSHSAATSAGSCRLRLWCVWFSWWDW